MNFLFLKLSEEWKQESVLEHHPNDSSIFPPLGLLYLGAMLENEGHQVEIIDFGFENLTKKTLEKKLHHVDAVGISVYTNNYQKSAELAHVIKELTPEILLIIGGPHCTFLKQQSLRDIPDADIAVVLEGEHTIIDIIHYLQGNKQLSQIHGIYYRNNNTIQSGKRFTICKNMDELPFPARHLVENYEYGTFPSGYTTKKKFTSMLTSRGCAFRCRFCSRYSNVIPGYGFRQRSADNVVQELQQVSEQYRSVAIVDDNFLADVKRSEKIFDTIHSEGLELELMVIGARVDTANETLYRKMKKAGVRYISYGIESGNQEILDYYNKNITLHQIKKAVSLGRKMNFFLSASFILGAPIETNEHIKNTIRFMSHLPLDAVTIRPFYYDMGAEFWNEEVKKGTIAESEYVVRADSTRGLGNFTTDEIDQWKKKAYQRFYLNPRYECSQVVRAVKDKDVSRIKNTLLAGLSPQLKNMF